jgi:hypothetical protein
MKPAIFYFLRSLFGYPRLGDEQTQGVGDTTPSSSTGWLKEEEGWVQLKESDLLTTIEEERAPPNIEQKKPSKGKKKKKKV